MGHFSVEIIASPGQLSAKINIGFTLSEIQDMLNLHKQVKSENLEEHLPAKQILEQIHFLERQRQEIELAINRLRNAYKRKTLQ